MIAAVDDSERLGFALLVTTSPKRPGHVGAQSPTTRRFTPKQGQYLAFMHQYTGTHGRAPAEADLQQYFRTSPPSVHRMVLALEKRGLIARTPGRARSIVLWVAADELPPLGAAETAPPGESPVHATDPASCVEMVTRTACTVITKLFERCDAYALADAEFLPLLGCVAAAVEQQLCTAGVAGPDAAAATRRVEDFAAEVFVALCARNDPDGADAQEDAETCRRLIARGQGPRG